jgi:hypothetical protein
MEQKICEFFEILKKYYKFDSPLFDTFEKHLQYYLKENNIAGMLEVIAKVIIISTELKNKLN